MGVQAGSLCCLKAELSGLRDKGPALSVAITGLFVSKATLTQADSCMKPPPQNYEDSPRLLFFILVISRAALSFCLPRGYPSRLCRVGRMIAACYLLTINCRCSFSFFPPMVIRFYYFPCHKKNSFLPTHQSNAGFLICVCLRVSGDTPSHHLCCFKVLLNGMF